MQADGERECPGCAQRLEQRDGIEVPMHVSSGRHGHRDRAQQHGHQAGDAQEAGRTIDRRLDLRSGVLHVLDLFVLLLVGFEPCLERRDFVARPREKLGSPQPAAGLHELRGREVVLVHDQARRQLEKRGALVRARDEDARDTERAGADVDVGSHARAQRRRQPRVRPYFAACGIPDRRLRRAERLIGKHHATTQWIFFRYRTQGSQLVGVAVENHAEQARAACDVQAAATRFHDGLVVHHLAGLQAQVGGEHFACLVVHGDADAIDEKPDSGQRGDRNRDGQHQHAELTRAPLAQQRSHRERQRDHGAVLT